MRFGLSVRSGLSSQAELIAKATPRRARWAAVAALIAILFGSITVIVGGKTLVAGAEERAAAGHFVPFVLWFNFIAGFAYIVAGIGLLLWNRWVAPLSAAIALATVLVFIAFGAHILLGGAFEMRTVGAMIMRSAVWLGIAALSCRALG